MCREAFSAVWFLEGLTPRIKAIIVEKVQQKRLALGSRQTHRKTLLLDLDETLIKASLEPHPHLTEQFALEGRTIWYALRPHLLPFLTKLATSF